MELSSFVVRLGEHDLSTDDEAESRDYNISFMKVHSDYAQSRHPFRIKNDIALLTLDRDDNDNQ